MADLDRCNVAILVTDGFEEAELTEPAKALGQAGAKVDVAAFEHSWQLLGRRTCRTRPASRRPSGLVTSTAVC
jgi:putative intracellular protease/amidase